MKRRLLSVILVLALIVSLIPAVSAEESEFEETLAIVKLLDEFDGESETKMKEALCGSLLEEFYEHVNNGTAKELLDVLQLDVGTAAQAAADRLSGVAGTNEFLDYWDAIDEIKELYENVSSVIRNYWNYKDAVKADENDDAGNIALSELDHSLKLAKQGVERLDFQLEHIIALPADAAGNLIDSLIQDALNMMQEMSFTEVITAINLHDKALDEFAEELSDASSLYDTYLELIAQRDAWMEFLEINEEYIRLYDMLNGTDQQGEIFGLFDTADDSLLGVKNQFQALADAVAKYENTDIRNNITSADLLDLIQEKPDRVSDDPGDMVDLDSNSTATDISTVEQFQSIHDNLAGNYRLTADLDLSGIEWIPIGTEDAPFTGTFDGNGYSIKNLTIDLPKQDNVGLFGQNQGSVINITMTDVTISGSISVGGVIGVNDGIADNLTVNNIHINANNNSAGGAVGFSWRDLENIYVSGIEIIRGSLSGGAVGYLLGDLKNAHVSGVEIQDGGYWVGGVAGKVSGTVTDCSASEGGNIIGFQDVGGLVGYSKSVVACHVSNVELIYGEKYVGGMVGEVESVYDSTATGVDSVRGPSPSYVGGLCGFVGKKVTNCTVTSVGYIAGHELVGGLCGDVFEIIDSTVDTVDRIQYSNDGIMIGGLAGRVRFVSGSSARNIGSVRGDDRVGGLAGATNSVSNCFVTNINEVSGNRNVGGLVGESNGSVADSFAADIKQVSGNYDVGGLIGSANDSAGITERCYATGNVSCRIDYTGGLVGSLSGTVQNCFSTGSVPTQSNSGGLVGTGKTNSITNCYTLSDNRNGVVGYGSAINSYFDKDFAPGASASLVGGRTTAELQQASTFEGWDFTNVWTIDANTYPTLRNLPAPEFVGGSTLRVTVFGQEATLSGTVFSVVLPAGSKLPYPDDIKIEVQSGTADSPVRLYDHSMWTFSVTDIHGKVVEYTIRIIGASLAVAQIEIISEPSRMGYLTGQQLSLEGMSIRIVYNDGSVRELQASEFGANGVSTIPAAKAPLGLSRNGDAIQVFCDGQRAATTARLTVASPPVVTVSVGEVAGTLDGNLFYLELPSGNSLPTQPSQLRITAAHGTAGTPTTSDGGANWIFTVTDGVGAVVEYHVRIAVAPEQYPAKILVTDGGTGLPLPGAGIQAVGSDGTLVKEGQTGGDGTAELNLSPGGYRFNVYKDGYYSRGATATVAGKAVEVRMVLTPRGTVSGSLTVTEMTKDEIIQAGIDPNAPGNEHIFSFETELEFTASYPGTPPVKLPSITISKNSDGEVVYSSGPAKGVTPGGETVTVYPITENFYLAIYGEAHWLKEMFDVELIVLNNSAVERIEGCEAALDLPNGLSLATMVGGAQNAVLSLADLAPGEQASAHWYVRGDREGSYNLSAAVTGAFVSDGAEPQPFSMKFSTSEPVEVLAGSAMHLYITAENKTWKGDTYNVNFRLVNVSDKPVYDLSLQLNSDQQYKITHKHDEEVLETIKQEELTDNRVEVAALQPGESINLDFSTTIQFSTPNDELAEAEYLLTGMCLKLLPESTTEIPYSFQIVPGYRSGTVRYGFREYNYMVYAVEGDPVNMLTGAFDWNYEDLKTNGRNPISYTRYYVSDDTGSTQRLGPDWSDNYTYKVETKDNVACVTLPKGEHAYFFRQEDGSYRSQDGSAFSFAENYNGYELVSRDGTEHLFDSNGELRTIINVDGGTTQLGYLGGRLATVVNDSGQLKFSYDKMGRLSSLTEANRTVYYSYDNSGHLSSSTNPDGDRFVYSYDENGFLTMVTDANGTAYVHNTYDEEGRVTEQTLADQGILRYTYDPEERINTCAGENGYLKVIRYDEWDRIISESDPFGSRQYTFNEKNQRISQTDALGQATEFSYDEAGNVARIEYADGTWEVYGYNEKNQIVSVENQDGVCVSYGYDGQGRMTSMTDPLGGTSYLAYDDAGNIVSSTDKLGNITVYTYDSSGNRLTETDPLGHITAYAYDEVGRLVSKTDPAGGVTRYEYSAAGKLVKTVDALGNEKSTTVNGNGYTTSESDWKGNLYRYGYDAQNHLISVSTPLGAVTRYGWDENGNVVSQTDPLGNTTAYSYDEANRLISSTDPLGHITAYNYDEAGRLISTTDALGGVTSYSYNELGERTSVTDPLGRVTEFVYDKLGNLVRTVRADGSAESAEFNANGLRTAVIDSDGYKTSYDYDWLGRVLSVIDPRENGTYFSYDAVGNLIKTVDAIGGITSRSYDALGNLSSETDALGRETTYMYDRLGRVVRIKDPAGETTVEYDANGNVTRSIDRAGNATSYTYDEENHLVSTADPMGHIMAYTYDAAGNLLTVTDGNGNVTRYAYDAMGRTVSVEDGAGNISSKTYDAMGRTTLFKDGAGAETKYSYDAAGRLSLVTDALGNQAAFTYDALDRVATVTDAQEGTTSFNYDGRGNIIMTTDAAGTKTSYAYDGNGNRISMTTVDGTTQYAYDGLNRLTEVIYPDKNKESFAYDALGRLLVHTDTRGGKTCYTYDTAGNLATVTDPLGNQTQYEYDVNGNLVRATDANGNETQYGYDAMNRLTVRMAVNGVQELYKYDANGNLVAYTDGDGHETNYAYNALDLVEHVNYGEGRQAEYAYDGAGRLTQVQDWTGTTSFELDLLGRITKATDSKGNAVGYSYDSLGRRTAMTYPDGSAVSYGYDIIGNLTSVTDTAGETVYDYDAMGRVTSRIGPEGWTERYTYDVMGNLLKVSDTTGGKETVRHAYCYDEAGNVVDDKSLTGDWTYMYDAVGRLRVGYNEKFENFSYEFDPAGNLTSEITNGVKTEYSYNNLNQLTEKRSPSGTTTYSYNGRGSLTGERSPNGSASYRYDTTGRLSYAEVDGVGSYYNYNVLGALLSAGDTELVSDYAAEYRNVLAAAEDGVTQRYTYGVGRIGVNVAGSNYSLLLDRLGSPELAVNMDGQLVGSTTYDPWGKVAANTPVEAGGLTWDLTSGYTGYWMEGSTGFYYAQARLYDSQNRRFTSLDPYPGTPADPISMAPYLYARDNPLGYTDPSGRIVADALFVIGRGNILRGAETVAHEIGAIAQDPMAYVQEKVAAADYALTDHYTYITVLECGEASQYEIYQRGIVSRVGQAVGGATRMVSGAVLALAGGVLAAGTGGVGAVVGVAGVVSGLSGVAYGASELAEAFTDYNSIRDFYLGGNSKAYYTGMAVSDISMLVTGTLVSGALNGMSSSADTNTRISQPGYQDGVCFVAGTLVETEGGTKAIEDVTAGELVLSRDAETGAQGYKEVLQTYIRQTDTLVYLEVDGTEIVTTPEHPFYVLDTGWVAAGELEAGYTLCLSDGDKATVNSVAIVPQDEPVTVYNFQVQDWHTYFVSELQVLVHNTCALEGGSGAKGDEIVFGTSTKSVTKLNNQMIKRGWTESTVRDTVSKPYTQRVSINKATGNPATVYYNESGGYVIIDDVTNAIVQVSDNINPSTWAPDPSIVDPYLPNAPK